MNAFDIEIVRDDEFSMIDLFIDIVDIAELSSCDIVY